MREQTDVNMHIRNAIVAGSRRYAGRHSYLELTTAELSTHCHIYTRSHESGKFIELAATKALVVSTVLSNDKCLRYGTTFAPWFRCDRKVAGLVPHRIDWSSATRCKSACQSSVLADLSAVNG
jgi:hypothetical protein